MFLIYFINSWHKKLHFGVEFADQENFISSLHIRIKTRTFVGKILSFFAMKKIFLVLLYGFTLLASAQEIKVMTYNIRYDNSHDGINSWTDGNRKEKVLKMIQEQQPDVFGLQEVLHHQLEFIESHFTDYHRVGVGRDDGDRAGEYAAIFFRKDLYKLLDTGHFWLSQTPMIPSKGWDATCCNRICTWVKLQYKNKIFFVFNTHFDHEGKVAQQESAKLILHKISEIAGKNKVILMGDFNMTPDNPAIAKISQKLYNTQTSEKNMTPMLGTYNDFNLSTPVVQNIDYVFLQKVKLIDFKILETRLEGLYPSDHFPVVVKVRL